MKQNCKDMAASEKLFASRIIVCALAFAFAIIGYAIYSEYGTEIQDELFEVVADTFPTLDNEIDKL